MTKPHSKIRVLRKPLIITGILVALLLVLSQVVFDAYVYRNTIQPGDQSVITNLVINAVRNLRKPAAIDPKTGNVYLTEAHLVLPPQTSFATQQILYSDNTTADAGTNVAVTTRAILSRAESKLWSAQAEARAPGWHHDPTAVFKQVPNLQACASGVQLFSKPQAQNKNFQLKATKQVADGRTLYMYTETTCTYDLTALTDYLKQAQSY